MKAIMTMSVLGFAVVFGGCATIMGSETSPLPLYSTPGGAKVTITDERGKVVYQGVTPSSVSLKKSDGTYWGGKTFTVEVHKEGFEKASVQVVTQANGYYVMGNLLFGGLIGWFIVDPATGAMYDLHPPEVDVNLHKGQASIMLLDDVPAHLRRRLVRIN